MSEIKTEEESESAPLSILASVIAMVLLAFTAFAVLYAAAWFMDGATGTNNITNTILILILIVPVLFFVGWASYDMVQGLYVEVIYALDRRRRQRR